MAAEGAAAVSARTAEDPPPPDQANAPQKGPKGHTIRLSSFCLQSPARSRVAACLAQRLPPTPLVPPRRMSRQARTVVVKELEEAACQLVRELRPSLKAEAAAAAAALGAPRHGEARSGFGVALGQIAQHLEAIERAVERALGERRLLRRNRGSRPGRSQGWLEGRAIF